MNIGGIVKHIIVPNIIQRSFDLFIAEYTKFHAVKL
jgi:hypothetical protein